MYSYFGDTTLAFNPLLAILSIHSGGRLNIPNNMVNVAWVFYGQTTKRWGLE